MEGKKDMAPEDEPPRSESIQYVTREEWRNKSRENEELGPWDWKRSVFIPIPKKGNTKKCSNYHTIVLISHPSKVMQKSFKLGFSTTWTENLQMYKLGLEKAVLCLVTQSCLTVCNPVDCNPPGYSVHQDSPGKNTGLGCYALLQGIFPTQGSHPGLLHCTAFSLLSESPVKPKSTGGGSLSLPSLGDSWAKNQTRVSCIAGWFLQTELPGKPRKPSIKLPTFLGL